METLHYTNKSNELCLETNFDPLAISKVKYINNHLYQKMILLLSGDINFNPVLVNKFHIREHKFNTFSSKELST